jgi:hypothetical protein
MLSTFLARTLLAFVKYPRSARSGMKVSEIREVRMKAKLIKQNIVSRVHTTTSIRHYR